MRERNPQLTTLLAIGGWNEGELNFTDPKKYSVMANDPKLRKGFVESVVKILTRYGFDGLDFDWEYPGSRGGDPSIDKKNFITLLSELKAAFDPHGFLLTVAVSAGKGTMDLAYDVPKMMPLVDYISVMGYDYHGGSWEDYLGHNAPLYARPDETGLNLVFNVNYSVNYWLELGADKSKMVLGMPLYGRTYTLLDNKRVHLGDKVKGAGPKYPISNETGIIGYIEVGIKV